MISCWLRSHSSSWLMSSKHDYTIFSFLFMEALLYLHHGSLLLLSMKSSYGLYVFAWATLYVSSEELISDMSKDWYAHEVIEEMSKIIWSMSRMCTHFDWIEMYYSNIRPLLFFMLHFKASPYVFPTFYGDTFSYFIAYVTLLSVLLT